MPGSQSTRIQSSVLPSSINIGVTGQDNVLINESTTDAITAKAGGGQSAATPLTTIFNRVTTVATAADSVTLPPALAGADIFIVNSAGVNSMNVFPNTGDTINAGAANAAFAVAAGKSVHLFCPVNGKWFAILTA